ncbi:MAG: aminotransferase class IV family protein [Legionellales bacterium]|nr:aminotransferase class IV family protein [Legionellales bacterium]
MSEFEQIVAETLIHNGLTAKDASLRLTITRGTGHRGLLPPTDPKPTVMLTAFPFSAHALPPANIFITSIRRNEFSPLCNIKSLSYLDNVLARREAVKNGADEGILLNTKGNVAEASAANIFMVNRDGIVITPRLEDGALPGITRGMIINICKELDIEISESVITQQELLSAKEVFLTNSLIEIQPVKKIDHQLINKGAIGVFTQQIQKAYQNHIKKQG